MILSARLCIEGHFYEGTVRELQEVDHRKGQRLGGSFVPEHDIDFNDGRAVVGHCPELGRCPTTHKP